MHDVAREAGVSLKTVSRVVNAEPSVGAATAARVTSAIDALGFNRNEIARSLRGRSSSTIGLVIGDISNPFYSTVARAVEEVASRHQTLLVTVSAEEDPERERMLVTALFQRRVDGLLVVPAGRDVGYMLPETRRGTPAVFLDRPPGGLEADQIVIDNAGGARLAVEHLLRQGHRRIGVVGDALSVYTAAERVQGYRAALEEAGVAFDEGLLRLGPHDVAQAEAATRELLSLPSPPTAIFTTNNRMSVGVLRARAAGSHRVAVVGFDDLELADMLAVPLTVIRHEPAEMGRRAAELLFARIGGDDRPPQRVVLPTELVPRGSGEVPPS
jgi:LacI family transcriptional regulator